MEKKYCKDCKHHVNINACVDGRPFFECLAPYDSIVYGPGHPRRTVAEVERSYDGVVDDGMTWCGPDGLLYEAKESA